MLFAPVRLGSTALSAEVLTADVKNCKHFGPCGVGEKALYLNGFLFDRHYYVVLGDIRRVFKRVAMSKGGFTGNGVFGAIPYLVVEYGDGTQAMLGVIACPITSGDTAFRSARLVLADWFHIEQKSIKGRLTLCIPVLGIGAILGVGNALGKIDYTIIWRYFSWTNQTLAMIVLWAASMYLFYEKKNYWITAVPATFMSAVSITYFMLGNECLGQFLNHKTADGAVVYNTAVAYPVGIIAAALFLGIFLYSIKKRDVKPQYETLGK